MKNPLERAAPLQRLDKMDNIFRQPAPQLGDISTADILRCRSGL